jgi:very-short-patch-repair endonuclease
VDVVTIIERLGGLASRAELIRATSRADVDRALASGGVARVGQGRYALPGTGDAAALAFRLNGHLSLTNAALHHGWEVKSVPKVPHVVIPRKRNLPVDGRRQVVVHRADLGPDDVSGIATSRELTLMQCLRSLPDDEALAIADSALRHGEDATLRRVVASVRGAGSAKVRRIAGQADARAANPFESVTRAICLQVPGLRVTPQLVLSTDHYWACPDLVDRERRIVIECDSWEWHGDRKGFLKDVRRYTLLSADRWTVLRFTWDDVMLDPDWVHEVLCRVVGVDARTEVPAEWCSAA